MPKLNNLAYALILALVIGLVSGPLLNVTAAPPRATSPILGAAASYSVLAGSIVTNAGASTMPGNLGISPSIGVAPHYTGFPPGVVGPPGATHDADVDAAAAQAANTAAFGALDQLCDTTYPGVQDLSLVSPLGPGVYCADAFLLTGNLTLTGSGVWIFKSAATLTTSSDSSVTGGDPCNIWWRLVSSGVIGTGTDLIGNILALTSISLATGATLDGRALAQTGAVTMDTNVITGPVCVVGAETSTPTSTATATATQTGTQATATPTATVTETASPTLPATNTQAPQNTPVPAATDTPLPAPTATATAPAVVGLPATGGGPLAGPSFPWSQAVLAGGLGALALGLLGAYRRARGAGR